MNDPNIKSRKMGDASGDSIEPPPLPTLPIELVSEIFCRLPVNLLMQLCYESKSFKSLIRNSKFAKTHLRCSQTDFTRHHLISLHRSSQEERHLADFIHTAYPLLSVFNAVVPASFTRLETPCNIQEGIHLIVGICNGIICSAADCWGIITLWNPSTRESTTSPFLENPPRRVSFTIYGFGYDNHSDDYKVVAVFCYKCDSGGYKKYTSNSVLYKTLVQVHTLGTHSWRKIEDFPSCIPLNRSGEFVSGTLNWLVTDENKWFILSLGLGNECYQKILLPDAESVIKPNIPDSLGVLRNCLCFISGGSEVCNVWLMKEYGNRESWTKLFSVAKVPTFPSGGTLHALHVFEDGELVVTVDSRLFLYNSRDNTWKTPQIQNAAGSMFGGIYVESLISPCS